MKSFKPLIILITLFFSLISNGQPITSLPQFKNEILIVSTYEEVAGLLTGSSIDISDGSEVKYSTELEPLKLKNQPENISILAQILNELKKQKYKLIGTNSAAFGTNMFIKVTNYVLQKE
jgi:hypothetical protein